MIVVYHRYKILKEILDYAREYFPQIYAEGLMACRNGSVKKYIFEPSGRILWLVVGKNAEYVIFERKIQSNSYGVKLRFFCICPDFLFHVLFKSIAASFFRRRPFCYHIIARVAAEFNELKKERGEEFDPLCLPEIFYEEDKYYASLLREIRDAIVRYEVDEYEEARIKQN